VQNLLAVVGSNSRLPLNGPFPAALPCEPRVTSHSSFHFPVELSRVNVLLIVSPGYTVFRVN
jgi:hypothetical protein